MTYPGIRKLTQFILLLVLLSLSVVLIINSWRSDNIDSAISSASLMVAMVSLVISFISINHILDARLPQLVLQIDTKSRYGLILLKLHNYGELPAFDIKIKWLKNAMKSDKSVLSDIEIPVLIKDSPYQIILDGTIDYYEKLDDSEMVLEAEITYKIRRNSWFNESITSFLDLSVYRKSPYTESEEQKALFDIQLIPKKLDAINQTLRQFKTNKL